MSEIVRIMNFGYTISVFFQRIMINKIKQSPEMYVFNIWYVEVVYSFVN